MLPQPILSSPRPGTALEELFELRATAPQRPHTAQLHAEPGAVVLEAARAARRVTRQAGKLTAIHSPRDTRGRGVDIWGRPPRRDERAAAAGGGAQRAGGVYDAFYSQQAASARPSTSHLATAASPGRPGAVKRHSRFPMKIHFVWGFCMIAQGA